MEILDESGQFFERFPLDRVFLLSIILIALTELWNFFAFTAN
jgi:hypothetical protein